MIISDGYSIEYYANSNRIEIILPQTLKSLTNTVSMVSNRRTDISSDELGAILVVVKVLLKRGKDYG